MIKNRTIYILFGCMFLMHGFSAYGMELQEQVAYKSQQLMQLKEEIKQIDSEMARCKETKSKWTTTTVLGALGVAATGTVAILQAAKINKNKKEQETPTSPEETQ